MPRGGGLSGQPLPLQVIYPSLAPADPEWPSITSITTDTLNYCNWLQATERVMPLLHYRIHAADVVRTLYCLLTRGGVLKALFPDEPVDTELLMSLLSAIIHDYEHKGVNVRGNLA